MSSTSVSAELPDRRGAPPAPPAPSRLRTLALPLSFLAPALVLLGVWILYPAIATFVRSFFSDEGGSFVWFQNYDRMFSNAIVHTAIRNTIVWILVAPIAVTALGLAFAVLTERIVWSSYFKIILFMPLAISLFAVGVIWRIVYQQDPDRGVLNAGGKVVHDTFKSTGVLPRAQPSSDALTAQFRLKQPLAAGDTALLGLTGISPRDVPSGADQAVQASGDAGPDHRRRLARLFAGRRQAGRDRGRRARHPRGHGHAAAERQTGRTRRRRPTTGRSPSRTSRGAATRPRSLRRPSPSRTPG